VAISGRWASDDGPVSDPPPAGDPAPLLDLDRRTRRRALLHLLVRVTATSVGLFGVFFVLPMEDLAEANPSFMLLVGMTTFVVILAVQLRAILRSDHPRLRAIEAVAVALPLIVVVFATIYLSISLADPAAFSEPLTRLASIYYTVTVLSTTGFGDITADGDAARAVVTIQMLIDLVLIAVVVRLLAMAAQRGVARQQGGD
jgi:hypothetical protein